MERLSSHTSTDDQKLYRSADDLRTSKGDPLKRWKEQLIEEGLITAEEYDKLDNEIKERVRQSSPRRSAKRSLRDRAGTSRHGGAGVDRRVLPPGKYRIGDTFNKTLLRAGLEETRAGSFSAKTSEARKAASSS
jgi:hypothetical protein